MSKTEEPSPKAPARFDFGRWLIWRLEELWYAILRALGRASRARAFSIRNHVFVESAKRSIVQPISETVSQARGVVQDARRTVLDTPDELFDDVPPELLHRWIRNARWAWVLQTLFALLSAGVAAHGAISPGFLGANMMIGGMLMTLFAVANGLRIARDVVIFRTRRALPFKAFWADIERCWNPLPKAHPAYWPVVAVVLPAILAVLIAAPILMVLP